jgi:hypothetical protein
VEGFCLVLTSVAVGVSLGGVKPSPVGVDGHGASDVCASTTSSTLGPGQGRMGLSRQGAGSLGLDRGHKGRDGGKFAVHARSCGALE